MKWGFVAAVAAVAFGTAVAYVANEYFTRDLDLEPTAAAATAADEAAETGTASVTPNEISEARTSAAEMATNSEVAVDDGSPQSAETESEDGSEPLPIPSAAEPETAATTENDAAPADSENSSTASLPPAELSEVPPGEARPPEIAAASPANEAGQKPGADQTVAAIDENAAAAPARPELISQPAETFRDCDLCPVMVKIPAGKFTMGSPESEEGRQDSEGPTRLVILTKPYAIGQYEITIGDWDACVKDRGCKHQIKDEGWGRDNRPAINVSWEDITTQFLPWLSKKTGHTYRLPTEAEWEYAARAIKNTRAATSFSFGNSASEICAFANGADATAKEQSGGGSGADCRDGYATTAPIGSFKPNSFGIHDMHGNVWEWVEDCWNQSYAKAPTDGSAWEAGDCSSRVVRGGSWNSDVPKLRSAARGWNQPSGRNRSIGFRIVREL